MATPQASLTPTFTIRDGALVDLQITLMAQDMTCSRMADETHVARFGRTLIQVRFGDSWDGRCDEALHRVCEIHHSFGEDMVGVRLRQRSAALPLAPVMVLASLWHRRH